MSVSPFPALYLSIGGLASDRYSSLERKLVSYIRASLKLACLRLTMATVEFNHNDVIYVVASTLDDRVLLC